MHWLLYVPREGTLSELLPSIGLADLAEGASYTAARNGPAGPGAIIGWDSKVPSSYRPKEQTWTPAVSHGGLDAGRYWVGTWNDRPPTPKECEKPHPVRGRAVTFGDGGHWTVPKAVEVPYTMMAVADGWAFAPLRRYASWLLTVDLWRYRCDEATEGDGYAFGEIADFVLESLQINYRLTREVATVREMFRSGNGECLLTAALAIVALSREGG